MTEQTKFECFAIVELMGRSVVAGYVSEQVIAGSALLRVDVPAVGEIGEDGYQAGFTKLYSASAIYAVTPTSEDVARTAAKSLRTRPVEAWIVPSIKRPDRALVDARGYMEPDMDWDGGRDDDDEQEDA